MSITDKIPKKRGRKPKNFNKIFNDTETNNCLSEDESIILHLKIPDVNKHFNNKNDNKTIDSTDTSKDYNNKKIFIKIDDSDDVNEKKKQSENKYSFINNINNIYSHKINISADTKCWWCKNIFNCTPVQLPEYYENNTFICIGHFCSFNCAKSYNISTNDNNIDKRNSLLNLMHYYIFSNYIYIEPAPHWQLLKEYGGIFTIEEYRNNIITNDKTFNVLKPPIISREIIIEETNKNDYNIKMKSKNKNIIFLSTNTSDNKNKEYLSNTSTINNINTNESLSKIIIQ